MENGEIVSGGIAAETRKAIENMIAVLHEAGYGVEDVVRVGARLDDPRDFWTFNGIYAEYFGKHPPARASVQARMMVERQVAVDCVAHRRS